MKILAADLKEWWALPDWPDDQSIDDDAYKVNGVEVEGGTFDVTKLADTDEVEVVCGSIIRGDTSKDLKRAIKAWMKSKTHVTIQASIPREREAEAIAALAALGAVPRRGLRCPDQ